MAVMAPAFELTGLERKLLRLALCGSAQGAEVTTSAAKLIESWRSRGVDSAAVESALENGNNAPEPAIVMSRPDFGLTRMPFGKHRGQMFMDLEPSYLRWTRRWINESADRALKFEDLANAIEQFLQQGS
jgi:hypothetical protein